MLRVSSTRTHRWGLGVRECVCVDACVCDAAVPHSRRRSSCGQLAFDAIVFHTFKGRLISHQLQRAPFLFSETHNTRTSILFSLSPRAFPLKFPLAVTAEHTHARGTLCANNV